MFYYIKLIVPFYQARSLKKSPVTYLQVNKGKKQHFFNSRFISVRLTFVHC